MQLLIARIAKTLYAGLLRFHMHGSYSVTASEVLALFDGAYPQEVFELFWTLPYETPRDDVLQTLREIANQNAMGALFAERAREMGIRLLDGYVLAR